MVVAGYYEAFRHLAARSDIELSLLGDCQQSFLDDLARNGKIVNVYPFTARKKLDFRAAGQLRRALEVEQPDIVHAFYGRPLASAVLATARMKRVPKIVSFRGIASVASRWDPGNLITYLHPRVAGHACESDAVAKGLIASGIEPTSCVTVYNYVEAGAYPRPGRTVLRSWNIPEDAFVVGTVATVRPVKGIDILMRAAISCADMKDVYWVIIGPVRDQRVVRLSSDARIRDRVRLLGYREDARALISGADVFAMPSRSEALCRALLEAMSQRVCPVVSDAGGMKEAVRNGIDGLVVPREDVAALANAIRRLHGDSQLTQTFAESACVRAREHFSAAKMGERMLTSNARQLT